MKKIITLCTFGVIMFAVMILAGCSRGKDFTAVDKEYDGAIGEIDISLSVAEIEIKKSDTDRIKLKYYESEDNLYEVKEESGKLSVVFKSGVGELKENIRFGLGMKKYYKVTLALPEGYNGNVKLSTGSGDVTVNEINSEKASLSIKTDDGNVKAEQVTAAALNVDGRVSEIVLKKLNISDISVVTVAGEVITKNIDCSDFSVSGEAAEVDIRDVSIGQVSVALTTGHVDLDNVQVGGTLVVSVTSGDVEADGVDASLCSITSTEGDIYLKNIWIGSAIYLVSNSGDIDAYLSDPVTEYTLDAVSDYGKNNIVGTTGFNGFKNLTVRNVTGDIMVKFAGNW